MEVLYICGVTKDVVGVDTFKMALIDTITFHFLQSLIVHSLYLEDIPAVLFLLDGPRSVVIIKAFVIRIDGFIHRG